MFLLLRDSEITIALTLCKQWGQNKILRQVMLCNCIRESFIALQRKQSWEAPMREIRKPIKPHTTHF